MAFGDGSRLARWSIDPFKSIIQAERKRGTVTSADVDGVLWDIALISLLTVAVYHGVG